LRKGRKLGGLLSTPFSGSNRAGSWAAGSQGDLGGKNYGEVQRFGEEKKGVNFGSILCPYGGFAGAGGVCGYYESPRGLGTSTIVKNS